MMRHLGPDSSDTAGAGAFAAQVVTGDATAVADAPVAAASRTARKDVHFPALDGWRGLSILAVLAAHLLPLGPSWLKLNYAAGVFGMALFFILSGFLITHFLLERPGLGDFLIRRSFRIVPLAWLCMAVAFAMEPASFDVVLSHFLFYANLPPQTLTPITGHLWSLCVEMQFYIGVAALVALFDRRGLMLLPALCLAHTGWRVMDGVYASSITYYRVDEIFAGCTLALALHGELGDRLKRVLGWFNPALLLVLLVIACMQQTGPLNYLRPYLAALLVGATIVRPQGVLNDLLRHRWLVYLASVSYALYVIHPLLEHTWLGSGDVYEKYMKRPLLFLVLFGLAHLSTFHFERPCTSLGKRIVRRLSGA
ncbi:acyltransferase family protein [Uliginosibacterium sp. H1]|uniref:acyltransferase family protein n=1 Tax=Uliginosibacterium sp. H1 TaxID=3114757 RepID=UPI002E185B34|nr:acyltransferase [Uliginosibacterium sp. H1]